MERYSTSNAIYSSFCVHRTLLIREIESKKSRVVTIIELQLTVSFASNDWIPM